MGLKCCFNAGNLSAAAFPDWSDVSDPTHRGVRMNRKCQIGFAIIVTALAACGGGAGSTTGTTTGTGTGTGTGSCTAGDGVICVLGTTFNPVDITIAKNASVAFTWQAGVHNIVFDAPLATGVADIGAFSDGSVSRTFTVVGTFPYHCTIHGGVGSGMHGTIKVQ